MRPVSLTLILITLLSTACPSLQSFYRGRDDVAATIDVQYVDDGIAKHRLDVYRPRDAKEKWPVVVFVHGGYWRGGDKTYWQAITGLYGNVGIALGELGVGAVITNYRLHPGATLDEMLDDVVNAVKWTRANIAEMGGDPDQLYLVGHSAGGHLVSLLGSDHTRLQKRGVDPAVIQGVVPISGIFDIAKTIPLVDEELRAEVFALMYPTLAVQARESPARYFSASMTPTFFIVGEHDYQSCVRDFGEAQVALRELVGDRAFFKKIPGNTHEDMVLEVGTARDEVAPAVAAFVKHIRARRGF